MTRTLLIVDDIRSNREILKNILGGEYEITEASNGEEALDILLRQYAQISAVLLDISMPRLNGYEVLKNMRANVLLASIPVIMITGSENEDARIKALSYGANDFVMKPYSSEILRHCLRNNIAFHEAAATVDALRRDNVTGLYNREAFFEQVKSAVFRQEPGYYIMASFDIDKFRVINDQYGTEKGDEVLRHVAETFARGFEPQGGICCRVSADKFAILYPAFFQNSSEIALIRKAASYIDGLIFPITFSIGRYVIDDVSLAPSAMYDRATLAASTVKGRYDEKIAVYDENMRRQILREQRIVGEMEFALKTRQFEVWFQPQYNHATDALIGAEALVRWRHPESGLLPPSDFIPIFEQNGFIYELDKFVWREVCSCLRRWRSEGRSPLPVSVNISRCDVFRPDMVDTISDIVTHNELPVELLRLEVTESAFSEDSQRVVGVVKELVARGFTVEIDDFGSGYSSLNTLKDVPAQILKLDMKFFENSGDSQRGGNIVESIVRMAKWLGMAVIAEGVETLEQANFLRSIGCNYIQGYLYAKPMPVTQYEVHCVGSDKEEKLITLETVENLDNNAFWDAKSMDTLIFNSYVGAACIFEYHNGTAELIRATEKYAQIIGGAGLSVEDALKINWNDHLDPESQIRVTKALDESIRDKREVSGEYVFLDLPGCTHETYLRSTMRVIAIAGDRYLVYCTNENITAQRLSEKRERILSRQLQAIMENIDSGVSVSVLRDGKLCPVFANDSYFGLLGYSRAEYEAQFTGAPGSIVPEDAEAVMTRCSAINASGQSGSVEFRIRRKDGAIRLLKSNITVMKYPGIDAPVQLSILRDITEERALEQREREAALQLQAMMDDIPGGFVRMRVDDDGSVKPVYFNKGFFRLVGMGYDRLAALYADDALAGVHPEDVEIVRRAVLEMLERGEAQSPPYRLRHGSGGYISLVFFGRCTQDKSGQTFLNIYYSDAAKQVEAEAQSKELLDNLPYGAALFTLEEHTLSLVHLNKRYRELVGRSEPERTEDAIFSAVNPEDQAIVSRELALAVKENRDISCDIRILCGGDNAYRPFHIAGRILKKSDAQYAIYAVYTPITDAAMSVQEMLPVALSAMMDAQMDFSFVKDRNMRYICYSRGAAKLAGFASPADMVGKTDLELFSPSIADAFSEGDHHVMERGEAIIDRVLWLPVADGSGRYFSTSKYPLKDAKGNIIGLYGIGRDITESRAIKSQYELLTNSIPGGIATYETRGDDLRLTFFSDGFCRLFELTRKEYEQVSAQGILNGVYPEDLPALQAQLDAMIQSGEQADCIYRVRLRSGNYKWINLKASRSEQEAGQTTFNAVLFDVTQRQEALEHLKISEEENRLAMEHTSSIVCRYDVQSGTLRIPQRAQETFQLPEIIENVPQSQIEGGAVSPATAEVYRAFYAGIRSGTETGSVTYQRLSHGGWCWLEGHYSTIFSRGGKPVSAVISFVDITDRLEKDNAYKHWQQSYLRRPPASYSLFRCNVRKDTVIDANEGALLTMQFKPGPFNFDARAAAYASAYVVAEDAANFSSFLNVDALLSGFYQGRRNVSLEYREKLETGDCRWLRLTVDLVEHRSQSDVEAYLLFENIDKAKRQELETIALAQTDPLTGVLNRSTFAAQVNDLIRAAKPDTQSALLMLDLDGFKQVNDCFGHSAGDQALIYIADSMRRMLRHDDLIGRLGGDEYMVFLSNIPGNSVAAAKAGQICAAARRSFSAEVEMSGSIGIAVTPRDGADFESLYQKADAALYHVKGSGKDSFAFYREDMSNQHLALTSHDAAAAPASHAKKRILIVDDSRVDRTMLAHIFTQEFFIETAANGNDALIRLRHYGSAVSVVLLDLMMPEMDGFAILEKMQESRELQKIPVIAVSGDDHCETGVQAIRAGAVDFVSKPVDPEVLRIRVHSAISKAENERLRAKNSMLEYRNSEIARCKAALESSGVVVIENDWLTGTFTYDPAISAHIAGTYNGRRFWQILLSDFVAETATVQQMQTLVQKVVASRPRQASQAVVHLKTPKGDYHRFRMSVSKKVNAFGLTEKLYMTFVDLETP